MATFNELMDLGLEATADAGIGVFAAVGALAGVAALGITKVIVPKGQNDPGTYSSPGPEYRLEVDGVWVNPGPRCEFGGDLHRIQLRQLDLGEPGEPYPVRYEGAPDTIDERGGVVPGWDRLNNWHELAPTNARGDIEFEPFREDALTLLNEASDRINRTLLSCIRDIDQKRRAADEHGEMLGLVEREISRLGG
jgi:hypothetical protein